MKKLSILLALLLCFSLCACEDNTTVTESTTKAQPTAGNTATQGSTEETTVPGKDVTEPIVEVTDPTEAITEPTEAPTEPTEPVTEPAEPGETATVYLLKKAIYFDVGYVEYYYDENYNLNSAATISIDNTLLYDTLYEERDANGMACQIRTQWADGSDGDILSLKYSADGKLQEELYVGSNYTGSQYAYDQDGNRTEKREYYDGILQVAVYFEYEDGQLIAAHSEDISGDIISEFRVENGLLVEESFYDYGTECRFLYEYDANNNLITSTYIYDGETLPGDEYIYVAVEVDAARAPYILEQQRYLIPIT